MSGRYFKDLSAERPAPGHRKGTATGPQYKVCYAREGRARRGNRDHHGIAAGRWLRAGIIIPAPSRPTGRWSASALTSIMASNAAVDRARRGNWDMGKRVGYMICYV